MNHTQFEAALKQYDWHFDAQSPGLALPQDTNFRLTHPEVPAIEMHWKNPLAQALKILGELTDCLTEGACLVFDRQTESLRVLQSEDALRTEGGELLIIQHAGRASVAG
jgi:hypothetical protein